MLNVSRPHSFILVFPPFSCRREFMAITSLVLDSTTLAIAVWVSWLHVPVMHACVHTHTHTHDRLCTLGNLWWTPSYVLCETMMQLVGNFHSPTLYIIITCHVAEVASKVIFKTWFLIIFISHLPFHWTLKAGWNF